jgi:nucleoside-diphosphate-sugar epimerase
MKFTILGANGFLGSSIKNHLLENHFECYAPDIRKEDISKKSLGHVIYSVGTVDFTNINKIVESHVCTLKNILDNYNFESFLYISTGRFYRNAKSTMETEKIEIDVNDKSNLYDISKLLGESYCLSSKKENIRIVRPSLVIGTNTPKSLFLPSIIFDALSKGKITLHSALESQRDYLRIQDFVKIIPEISLGGKEKIYNIADGKNIKTKDFINEIVKLTNCSVEVVKNSPNNSSPEINIDRIKNEFNFKSKSVLSELESLITNYKKFL